MTHDELVAALKLAYPNTEHGADYLVGHPIGSDGRQIADAYIMKWNMAEPEPTVEYIWAQYGLQAEVNVLDELTRRERYARLVEADQLVEKAIDQENVAAEKLARKYRQQLRDLPQTEGWPTMAWPEKPL